MFLASRGCRRAINRQQLAPKQIKPPARTSIKLPKNHTKGKNVKPTMPLNSLVGAEERVLRTIFLLAEVARSVSPEGAFCFGQTLYPTSTRWAAGSSPTCNRFGFVHARHVRRLLPPIARTFIPELLSRTRQRSEQLARCCLALY
jgi:hypothetical protein